MNFDMLSFVLAMWALLSPPLPMYQSAPEQPSGVVCKQSSGSSSSSVTVNGQLVEHSGDTWASKMSCESLDFSPSKSPKPPKAPSAAPRKDQQEKDQQEMMWVDLRNF